MAHFSTNGRMSGQMEDAESSDSDHRRKRRKMGQNFQQAAAGPPAAPATKPNSFAAKMMAKMGYKEGQGLGAEGKGRLAPIETQQRPTGAGLGAVREKTKQAKEEEKREAAFRGEVFEDSEEEEEKRRKELKKKARTSAVGGTGSTPARPRPKYRTAAEIEASAEGLEVPNVLKSIIDATGSETKLLTSTAGLMSNQSTMVAAETEAAKIARRARRDLEAYAEEWNVVSERKRDFELQEAQIFQEMEEQEEETRGLESAINVLQELQLSTADDPGGTSAESAWENAVQKLESLENDFIDQMNASLLQEIAVAAIHPLFKRAMQDWHPLEDPISVSTYLTRISKLLGISPSSSGTDVALSSDPLHQAKRTSKSTTPYETMLYTLLLPPLRHAITSEWDPTDPGPLLTVIQTWSPILPQFILTHLTHNLIPTRLTTLLSTWKASKTASTRRPQPSPHTYIFPWLPYLPPHQLSLTSATGLFYTLKDKLKSLFQSYPLSSPPPNTLTSLLPVLPASFLKEALTRHLIPRLSSHLSNNFLIDPSNQDLAPLTEALTWLTPSWSLSSTATAAILESEFFPKWHHVLYLWLTSSPNYDEIRQWFLWWKEQFPPPIRDHAIVAAEWNKGLQTISLALDLGPENVASQLPPPAAGPVRALSISSANRLPQSSPLKTKAAVEAEEPITFRAVLES
ncbi:MAG: hypothetical protein Q9207_008170, partial [Kuettlingeria erythrocarpa]